MTRIKICGLSREEDIANVNEAGPDYCGFIIQVPRSRRNVSPERAAELSIRLDGRITPVGVFVNAPAGKAGARGHYPHDSASRSGG